MIPNNRVMRYLILVLGLIAWAFSGLNWNVGIAAWAAPALLLYYSKNSKWAGLLFLFLGLAFSSAISKTAENLSGIFLIYITTGLSYGLVYSLPYVIEKLLVKKGVKFYSTMVFPSLVVATEHVLSLVIGIWGNSAVAQYRSSNLIQITSVIGIYGISFLIAWLASILNWMVKNEVKSKRLWMGLGIYGIVIVSVLLFGLIRKKTAPAMGDTVRVAAIVGETDIHQVFDKWEEEIMGLSKNNDQEIPLGVYSDLPALESLIDRTEEALSKGAEIVVWNEISLLLRPLQTDTIVERIKDLCMKYQAYVLIAVLERNLGDLPMPFNNMSILVNPDGEISWEYLKHFLNPLEGLVINKGSGPIPYIDTEFGRIANVICSDLDLSAYIFQIGKKSVDILLVPAYDWEAVTPYHAHMAKFAAIQYGVNIVRANGKGIVAFYDTWGNVLIQNNTLTSEAKITYADLPQTKATTLYSSIGNLFVHALIMFLLVMIGLRFSKKVDI
jgi:apolipoprotein N-acyltransferase